jgi:ketol-acid reductoisomerase
MASRSFTKAIRTPLARQFVSPVAQRRTFVSTFSGARAAIAASTKVAVSGPARQARGLKTIDFAGTKETVYGM